MLGLTQKQILAIKKECKCCTSCFEISKKLQISNYHVRQVVNHFQFTLKVKSEEEKGLLSFENYEKAKEMLLSGKERKEVAVHFNVSVSAIRKVINFYKLKLRYIKHNDMSVLDVNTINQLINENKTRKEIANFFNVKEQTLRTFAFLHGISFNGTKVDPFVKSKSRYELAKEAIDLNELKHLINSFYTVQQLLDKYNIDYRTLKKLTKDLNLSLKNRWIGQTSDNNDKIRLRGKLISEATLNDNHWLKKTSHHNRKIFSDKISKSRFRNIENGLKNPTWISYNEAIERQKSFYDNWNVIKNPTEDEYNAERSGISLQISCECTKCKKVTHGSMRSFFIGRVCQCQRKVSSFEKEVRDFIMLFFSEDEIVFNDRKIISPNELDIFIPRIGLAIECNGVYWHSTVIKNELCYHEMKYIKCKEKNVDLFYIFSDDWTYKQDIIKSMLIHRFNQTKNKFGARKLQLQEVSLNNAKLFFDENHILGFDNKTTRTFALSSNNDIVCAIACEEKHNKIKILQFSVKKNTHVSGGFTRLINHIKKYAILNRKKQINIVQDLQFAPKKTLNLYSEFEFYKELSPIMYFTDGIKRFRKKPKIFKGFCASCKRLLFRIKL